MKEDAEKLVDKPLSVLLQAPFDDDKADFAEIKNNQLKFQEINRQNGEHFSHFNANLLVLTDMIEKHMSLVEPMLISYERLVGMGIELGGWGKKLGIVAGFIASAYVIIDFFVNHILSRW